MRSGATNLIIRLSCLITIISLSRQRQIVSDGPSSRGEAFFECPSQKRTNMQRQAPNSSSGDKTQVEDSNCGAILLMQIVVQQPASIQVDLFYYVREYFTLGAITTEQINNRARLAPVCTSIIRTRLGAYTGIICCYFAMCKIMVVRLKMWHVIFTHEKARS